MIYIFTQPSSSQNQKEERTGQKPHILHRNKGSENQIIFTKSEKILLIQHNDNCWQVNNQYQILEIKSFVQFKKLALCVCVSECQSSITFCSTWMSNHLPTENQTKKNYNGKIINQKLQIFFNKSTEQMCWAQITTKKFRKQKKLTNFPTVQ